MNGRSVLGSRCTVVVAAAGYGKTTAVQRWLGRRAAVWRSTPDPSGPGPGADWLVLDDLCGPPDGLAEAVAAAAAGGPRVVLVSRRPVAGVPAGWLRTGQVVERGPAHLALTRAATTEVLARDYGVGDRDLARRVHRLTAGWPVLVRLVGDALHQVTPVRGDLADALADAAPLSTYLDEEVLATVPAPAQRVLRDVAGLGPVDAGLCRALGHARPDESLRWLARTGLLVPAGAAGWRVVPLLDRVVARRWPRPAGETRRIGSAAARVYAANGQPREAALACRLADDPAGCADLLAAHGVALVSGGGARTVADLVQWLPAAYQSVSLRTVRGEALLVLGEDQQALSELEALAGQTGDGAVVPAALAWRLGALHNRRGEPAAALAAVVRGRVGPEPDTDAAMLVAVEASARWMFGDAEGCRDGALRAAEIAETAGDDRARSAAQFGLAMAAALIGDTAANEAHYSAALRYAEAAGDLVQAARILINRSSKLLDRGHYAEAVTQARQAAELAEAADCPAGVGVALCNEGHALVRLARLDEAAEAFDRALAIYQRLSSPKLAYPLTGLGDVHRWCGRPGLARAAYEEALRVADPGEVQGFVPALTGLARLLAEVDVTAAAALADRAVRAASGPYLGQAVLARGWVALAAGEAEAARCAAEEAAVSARHYRARADLADALELRAAAAGDPAAARRALREAADTWRLVGARLDADRVAVALAALPGAEVAHRVEGLLARDRLECAGVAPGRCGSVEPACPVIIRTLGRFEVIVYGSAVPPTEWRSRKARDLLRILVSRRGRPVTREYLVELLWGGDDKPARLAHRLSVALSTVRGVLDPDRLSATDRFVLADSTSVALDVTQVSVDLEAFLVESAHGLRLRERGDPEGARAVLAAAERRYTGDFLAGEPYEDWALAAREEARAAYLHTARTLAHLFRRSGQVDETVRYLLRLLDHDPYDERAHLDLVDVLAEAGRHGESRRAQDRYLAAMTEIGVRPTPTARVDRA